GWIIEVAKGAVQTAPFFVWDTPSQPPPDRGRRTSVTSDFCGSRHPTLDPSPSRGGRRQLEVSVHRLPPPCGEGSKGGGRSHAPDQEGFRSEHPLSGGCWGVSNKKPA